MKSHSTLSRFSIYLQPIGLALVVSLLGLAGMAQRSFADINSTTKSIWAMKYGVSNTQINETAPDLLWLSKDDDGDGMSNGSEMASGTSPFNGGSVVKITTLVDGGASVDLTFPTENGKFYVVQGTPAMGTAFTSTGVTWLGVGGGKTLNVTKGANLFFRILVQDADSDSDGASDWSEKIAGYDANNAADGGDAVLTAAIASSDVITVTVTKSSATQPQAGLAPVESGSITVSRGGPLKFHVLTVPLQKSGSATEGIDFDYVHPLSPAILTSATFPVGVGEVVLTVNPKANILQKTNVTAIVKALAGPTYALGSKISGSVVINPAGITDGDGLTGQYHNASSSTYATQQTIFAGAPELTRIDPKIDFNGIASITTGNPCTVTMVAPHGLATGTPVTIAGVTGGTFSPAINGRFVATSTGASTFTVASNCTAIPTSLLTASVSGTNSFTSVTLTNPCTFTTTVPHGFGPNGTQVPVAINWLNGGTFTTSINSTLTATVTGTSTFTVPVGCSLAPSAAQLAVGTISGPAGVNGWGSTRGPSGLSTNATGGAWSVRWTGQVLPQYSETYTFDARSSSGSAKLWVNGQLLVDRWATATTTQDFTNTITLQAGTLYDIQMEYWSSAPASGSTGFAEARLYWWSPSQTRQIIPQGRLFHAPAAPANKFTTITSSLVATGYEGVPFSFNVTTPEIGGAVTYALAPDSGPLPPGLSLNTGTGLIDGIPSTAGTYNVAINSINVATVKGSSIVDFTIFPTGGVTRETLVGTTITADGQIPTLDDDTDYSNNTSRRLRGYIVPPKTGNYYFWVAANNTAELWVSTNAEYVNRVRCATLAASTGKREWNAATTQQSPWLALEGGQKYYFEVLHNTGSDADDHVAVGWCQDDIGTIPSTSANPNPTGLLTVLPNGGASLQGYPFSGTAPGYIFQPYDYPAVTPPSGTLYATNLGPQAGATTSASGSANIQVNAAETEAILHFSYQNLGTPKTSYHLHVDGFTGDDSVVHPQGEIIYDIDDADQNPAEQTGDGGYIWSFSPVGSFSSATQLREALHKGKVYLNIHSVTYPNGEIRGTFGLIDGSQTPPDASLYPEPSIPVIDLASVPSGAPAARFLNQASFGASPADVTFVKANGFQAWITDQLTKTPSHTSDDVVAGITANINTPYPSTLFTDTWWKKTITGPDQLRQRLAFALSEIMVISWANNSGPLRDNGRILADYYDQLVDYCLPTAGLANSGNFRGILKAVSLTPAMGLYLDMRANQKGDDTIGRHPNENYARELNQLFSIGIYRMWDDGRFVLGSDAGLVPTYIQPSIIGFANLLTGWNYAQPNQANGRAPSNFGPAADYLNPMVLVPVQHELSSKLLLNNVVSPAATGRTPRVTISSVSTGTPCTVNTSTIHGLKIGDTVTIANVSGGTFVTPINTSHQVTQIVDADSFKVAVNCSGPPTVGATSTVTGATVIPAGISGTAGIAAVTGSQADNAGTGANHPYDLYGLTELDRAVDNIVNNDNVGPYICRQLIQRLVTSDPSPGYVYRVVQKFRNNGSGVRGDLVAVVSQILLDGEARRGSVTQNSTNFGKQREPMLRLTGPARAFPAANYTGTYTQLTGVNSNRLRIVTSPANDFSSGFTVSLNFRENYVNPPVGQTVDPYTNPTSTNYSLTAVTAVAIAKTWTGISSIPISSPAQVTTTEPHGLTTGNSIRITGAMGAVFTGDILGTSRVVTVIDATNFTINGIDCTTAATNPELGKMVSNPCRVTTTSAHYLATGDTVTMTGVTGGAFSPTIIGSSGFVATVIDSTSFTIGSNCTSPSTDNTGTFVGANASLDVAATGMVNATYSQSSGSNIVTVSTTGPPTNAPVPGSATSNVVIASISVGNPCTVTTSAAHNLVTGGVVSISNVADGTFGTSINGIFVPTVTGANTFTIPVDCTEAPSVVPPATVVGNSSKRIRSKVYLAFLTQTTVGGAVIPTDGIFEVMSNPTTSSFTVITGDTPVTGRGGNVLLPKVATSYTPESGIVVKFNTNVNHNMLVGQSFWVDVPVVGNPLIDAEYAITTVIDEDHVRFNSTPVNSNGGTYPDPSGSNNGVTIYPLVAPPLGRSGSVTINQSTFNLGSTEATLDQSPLNAPTVFNFFFPDYKFPGTLANNGLDSPEFQLTTDTAVMNLTNSVTNMLIGTAGGNTNLNGLSSFNNGNSSVVLDIGPYMTNAKTANGGIPALIDELANLLVGAPLEASTKTTIQNFVANTTNFPYTTPTNQQKRDRVRAIIHLILTSAEYAVQK